MGIQTTFYGDSLLIAHHSHREQSDFLAHKHLNDSLVIF